MHLILYIAAVLLFQIQPEILAAPVTSQLTIESTGWLVKPWRHRVRVTKSDAFSQNCIGVVHLRGGHTDDQQTTIDPLVSHLESNDVCLVVQVSDLPNQPLQTLTEDGIIARSFRQFLDTPATSTTALHAMRDAVKKVLDTVEKTFGVHQFVVTGQSKRGWTSWMVAAADARVKAVVPVVFDLLNIRKNLEHHRLVYGAFTAPLQDYVREGVLRDLHHSRFVKLAQAVDPLQFKINKPMFIINAANDQFFPPDSAEHYWSRLASPKYLRYVPNSGHHIDDAPQNYHDDILTFVRSLGDETALPQLQCMVQPKHIKISWDKKFGKATVTLHHAHSKGKRDFRLGKADYERLRQATIQGSMSFTFENEKGWNAWLMEATFQTKDGTWRQTCPVAVRQGR